MGTKIIAISIHYTTIQCPQLHLDNDVETLRPYINEFPVNDDLELLPTQH